MLYQLPTYPFLVPPELSQNSSDVYFVVVVGGGLSGLTTACALAVAGVPVVLLDEDNTVGVKGAASRGICYTQKSLEIFDKLGIYQKLVDKGIQWSIGRAYAGEHEVFSFDLNQQFSYGLQPKFINIQQFYIEMFLVNRLEELKAKGCAVDLRWLSKVVQFENSKDQAILTVETPAGSYTIQTQYVVDATGANTPFHEWLGVAVNKVFGDDRWCIADIRFPEHLPPIERITWIEASFNDNRAVWQHLMADNVWRIDYQMPANSDPDYISRPEVVADRLRKQFGDLTFELVWVGPYLYRSQCIQSLFTKNVFFVGDSVKLVSPFGARGGNSGIADADNLAWKLAAFYKQRCHANTLSAYHAERHQAALENVKVSRRTARFLRPQSPFEGLLRSAVIGLAKEFPFARLLVNTGRMALANPYQATDMNPKALNLPNLPISFFNAHNSDISTDINRLILKFDGKYLLLLWQVKMDELKNLKTLFSGYPIVILPVYTHPLSDGLGDEYLVSDILSQLYGHVRWILLRADSYVVGSGDELQHSIQTAIEKNYLLKSTKNV
ncbi:MAG: FAD-dependent oxidoreductase [Gammaproteobacteria bacterium]|nr:FAD-dependent oxidoreductase [Gammaproteobacteria bacterium]